MGVAPHDAYRNGQRYVLAIETSNPSALPAGPEAWFDAGSSIDSTGVAGTGVVGPSVALGRLDGAGSIGLVAEEALQTKGRHDDDLLPAIDRVVARGGIRPRDLGAVAFSAGPGGFTGLRIAATVAKMLSESVGAEVIAVPSAVASTRHLGPDAFPACVLLASKRETAHASVIGPDGWAVVSTEVLDGAGLRNLEVATLVVDQHCPEGIAEAAEAMGLVRRLPHFSARSCLLSVGMFSGTEAVVTGPIYAREPEAVRKWRELGRSTG